MSEDYRTERDSLGEMQVPADAYWGAQTQRAVENFPISGITFGRRFVRALGVVKKAAAQANYDLGLLDEETADAIADAADEVIAGEHDDQFPVDVFQTGSGTSSNMNVNEVVANRAAEILGKGGRRPRRSPERRRELRAVEQRRHPDRDARRGAGGRREGRRTGPGDAPGRPRREGRGVRRRGEDGRTHLQDATPVRLGQEFGGYRTQVEKGRRRVEDVKPRLAELALGGTAVGTGLNTHPDFPEKAAEYISKETGIDFREADNHFEAQAAHDAMSGPTAHSARWQEASTRSPTTSACSPPGRATASAR